MAGSSLSATVRPYGTNVLDAFRKPREFHLFSQLPTELQDEIWKHSLEDIPGVVLGAVDFAPFVDPGQGNFSRLRKWMPWPLVAHQGARAAARRLGYLHVDVMHPGQEIWFNAAKDALFFRGPLLTNWAMAPPEQGPLGREQYRSLLRTVQKAVVPEGSVARGKAVVTLAHPVHFPSIRKLIIMSSDLDLTNDNVVTTVPVPTMTEVRNGKIGDGVIFLRYDPRDFAPLGSVLPRLICHNKVPFTSKPVIPWKLDSERLTVPGQPQWTLAANNIALEACWMLARKRFSLYDYSNAPSVRPPHVPEDLDVGDDRRRLLRLVRRIQGWGALAPANSVAAVWHNDAWTVADLNGGYSLTVETM